MSIAKSHLSAPLPPVSAPGAGRSPGSGPSPASSTGSSPADQLRAWLDKYTPVERAVIEARERRLANAARRRADRPRDFADLCEATGGLAVVWRREGTPLADQVAWADGDVFTLACLARCHRQNIGRALDRLRHQVKRPLYYAAENARRRELAEERRRVRRRTTENPCPTRDQILDAWIRRRASHADAIRFGSLVEDLECYLDNTLLRDEAGNIVGRRGGVKRWLQTEIPALYVCYTTVMRYKAAARKLRQIAEVRDPVPAARIVEEEPASAPARAEGTGAHPAEGRTRGTAAAPGATRKTAADEPPRILRARAIWREVTAGVRPSATALMARLDALLDPERTEEANMLAEWREKYENEITVRTKCKSSGRELGGKGLFLSNGNVP